MRVWWDKAREVLASMAPVLGIVVVLGLTVAPLSGREFLQFLLGALLFALGLTVFLVGVDRSVSPFGQRMGELMVRPNRVWIVAVAGVGLGFLVSVAEPDLHILAGQIAFVTDGFLSKWTVVLVVSGGIAALVAAGLLRNLYNIPLYRVLTVLYGIIFALAILSSPVFFAISFDASGATTGAVTVPFILALALGVAALKKDSKASEKDSFGLVGTASAGVVLAVLVLGLFLPRREFAGTIDFGAPPTDLPAFYAKELLHQAGEALYAIVPLFVLFLLSQLFPRAWKRRAFLRGAGGFGYAFLGLSLLLAGVNGGFMDTGREIASRLALRDGKAWLVVVALALGLVTVLAEPAVHVLTRQIEAVTSGSVRRGAVLVALSAGVGAAVALSILRILIPALQLWHLLVPAFALALVLANIGPKLFVGIAFDAGGVASGPMTATFILAFAQGAANATHSANVLVDGFGVIALVATTPIVTLQILGLIYRAKTKKKEVRVRAKR